MQAIKLPLPPKELRDVSNPLEYRKTQAYQSEKWWFSLVQGAFSFSLSTSLLYFMYLPWLWGTSTEAVARLGLSGEIKARLAAPGVCRAEQRDLELYKQVLLCTRCLLPSS